MKENKILSLLAAFLFLAGCGGKVVRPDELVQADGLFANAAQAEMIKQVDLKLYQDATRYYNMARTAFEEGEQSDCVHYSLLAAIKFSTGLELLRQAEAEQRRLAAERRRAEAEKVRAGHEARLLEAEKRIARMEKIMKLEQKLALEKQQAEAEKKRVAEEQAKMEQLKLEKQVGEVLAGAQAKVKMAEALEAGSYDPGNFNSAQTFLKQGEQALAEKRLDHARDLAAMAVEKAELAIKAAQDAYAKKSAEAERLKERENLLREANAIAGAEAIKDSRGVVITLRDMFASGKTEVLAERTALLDQIAELARKYTDYPLVIEGYTDSMGRDADNLTLSQGRAQAVADYLIQQQKMDMNRLKASGYGEARPVADNSSREGRAKNRRVEVIFLFR